MGDDATTPRCPRCGRVAQVLDLTATSITCSECDPAYRKRREQRPAKRRERLRIALIAPCWFPVPPPGYGGIERIVALLADGLTDRGHEVTLFAAPGSATRARLVTPLDARPDPSRLGDPWIESTHAIGAYLAGAPVDIVHDHSGPIGAALAAARRDGPPVVHTLHGPWTPEARALYGLIDDRIALVAISDTQRRANPLVRYAGVVHNGVDTNSHVPAPAKGDHLVFVGRANPGKNPAGAIAVARRAGRPLEMLVKCREPAERDYWHAEVEPLLGEDVHVVMDAADDQKTEALASARAKVFPIQWDEPFGLVMAEALACGTPVVATPRGAAVEIVDDGRTGFLRTTTEELAEATRAAEQLSPDAARAAAVERFSADAMVRAYEDLYRSVLAAA